MEGATEQHSTGRRVLLMGVSARRPDCARSHQVVVLFLSRERTRAVCDVAQSSPGASPQQQTADQTLARTLWGRATITRPEAEGQDQRYRRSQADCLSANRSPP